MSQVDAATARGMSQYIQLVQPGVQEEFINLNPLLRIAERKGHIKFKGSHTDGEWYIRKTPSDIPIPSWGGGELGIQTFEEVDPANRCYLPYCYLQKNYGVSDRSLETNRHAGRKKIFSLWAESIQIAKINLYARIRPDMWNGSSSGNGTEDLVGLKHAFGDAYETTSNVTVDAAKSYANRTLNTSAIAAYSADRAGFDDPQWGPEVTNIHEIAGVSASPKWSVDCLIALAYMASEMELTPDVTGTAMPHKPDFAFMAADPFHALSGKAITAQAARINTQLRDEDLKLAGWNNIVVDSLTCVKDKNVPDDSGSLERVVVLDSGQYWIYTTHTKKEGLVKSDSDINNILVNGSIGKLTVNMFQRVAPTAVGVITGCND